MATEDLSRLLDAQSLPDAAVALPRSGTVVSIARLLRTETRVAQPIERTANCWAPNKPSVLIDGRATWAEFAIVRQLERAGWDGRWMKNWTGGREFCRDHDQPVALPDAPAKVFAGIHDRATVLRGAGSWDVFAWRGDEYLFIESKQYRRGDRLNANQLAWLGAALDVGISIACFAIVEYDAGRPISAGTRG